jgi:phosphatidylglycerophosphate synthase
MFTLWVLCHGGLILCGLFIPVDNLGVGLYAAAACSLGPTILVFAILFITASLVGAFTRWVRARTGAVVSPVMIATAYAVGLGTLAASVLFAYRIGFSTSARFAFVVFAAATCGMLSARKQATV